MDLDELRKIFLHGEVEQDRLSKAAFDQLMAEGWRNFGTQFFRYNLSLIGDDPVHVIPLRIRLADFKPSVSQKRILQRNADLDVEIAPIDVTDEVEQMFSRHRVRFEENPPESIYIYLSDEPARKPVEGLQFNVRDIAGKLLAVGLPSVGSESLSAVYTCFEPEQARRSLGIFTILKEIEYGRFSGMTYYYHGYAYDRPSYYDYKKRFSGLEAFDWKGNWAKVA
jgi:arginine-tRNA-protein transferase